MSEPRTVNDLLAQAARRPGGGPSFLDRHEWATFHSWTDIHDRARDVGERLAALGVEPGERVALIYPTGVDFFHAFFGVLAAGAVPVPLYPPARLGRLDEYYRRTAAMLRAASARLVLTDRRVRSLLGPAVAEAKPRFGCRKLTDLPAPVDVDVEVDENDLALVQFSSGTTVDPKPVALSHRAILAQVRSLSGLWPDSPGLRHSAVSWLPLYHDMGLIGGVFMALERAADVTLIGPELFIARPALWLRALSTTRATLSVAPNFAYGLCVEKIDDAELDGVDLSGWRMAVNGAEPVSPAVLRRFQQRFAAWGFRPEALTPVYGLSEATLAVTVSDLRSTFKSLLVDRRELAEGRVVTSDDGEVELISVGCPLPGTELRIDGENDVGRVLVRGPSVMDGYLDRPEATAEALRDGWLDTGDLGFLHDGELYLTGRAKDVVILRGRNHSPVEIEHAVDAVDGVRTGCAVAVSTVPLGAWRAGADEKSRIEDGDTERLLLFVEFRRGIDAPVLQSLSRRCAEEVLAAAGVRPDEVVVLPPGTLPRTSSGKLRRREALRLHLAGELTPPREVTPWLLARAVTRSALAMARARTDVGGTKNSGADDA